MTATLFTHMLYATFGKHIQSTAVDCLNLAHRAHGLVVDGHLLALLMILETGSQAVRSKTRERQLDHCIRRCPTFRLSATHRACLYGCRLVCAELPERL